MTAVHIAIGDSEQCAGKATDFNEGGSGSLHYLDRHDIECDHANEYISRVKFIRIPTSQDIRYEYSCW